jgi:hypothetical protein
MAFDATHWPSVKCVKIPEIHIVLDPECEKKKDAHSVPQNSVPTHQTHTTGKK